QLRFLRRRSIRKHCPKRLYSGARKALEVFLTCRLASRELEPIPHSKATVKLGEGRGSGESFLLVQLILALCEPVLALAQLLTLAFVQTLKLLFARGCCDLLC